MGNSKVDELNKKNIELVKLTEELKSERDRLHNALDELSEAKEFYRIMGEALPYGIWMCDAEGKARYMSQSFLDLLEMTLEEAQEFGWAHRLPPEDVDHMFKAWLECVRTGKDWDSEHRIIGPDGKYHTVLTRGKSVRDKDGKILSWVGINLDIDLRKKMEQEARQKEIEIAALKAKAYEDERKRAEALAELDRSKTIFFSNISHEFRTPLTLILGPVEDLLNNSNLPEKEKAQLKIVQSNSNRLLKLVNTLMDFARLEAGRVQASFEPVDLSMLTSELVSLFRSAIEKAGLKLIVSASPVSEPVYVDREMWEKIVFNLLSNAFKYTLQGEIEISIEQKDRKVQLKVRDTGIGISNEEMPHLFERFYRVSGAKGRSVEGTGIGLSLLYELVKIHGGTITAESTPGKGSTFIVELPLGKEHIPEEKILKEKRGASISSSAGTFIDETMRWLPDENPEETSAPRSTVLVVDDNADMRDYLKRLLSNKYNTIAASNGREALEIISNNKPDIVLTDILMPEIDGLELLQYIRNNSETKTLPVIMLTARAGEESRVEVFEAGADAYLVKPFSARELLTYVKTYLEMSRLRAKAAVNEEIAEKEKELRKAQEQYHYLFNAIDEGFCIIEILFNENKKPVDYRFIETNPAFEKQTGFANAQGKRMRELAHDHEEYWFEIYGKVALTGEAVRFENRAEELHRWYDVYAFRAGPPEMHRVAILFNDITLRKQDEETIRNTKEQYELVFNSIEEGFANYKSVYDETGRLNDLLVIDINPAGALLSGVKREDQIGKTWKQVWTGIEDYLFDIYREIDRKGGYHTFEHFSGITKRWYTNNIYKIAQDQFAVTFHDITVRKEAEEALNERLQEKEVLLREIYHRTKNTLQLISSMLSLRSNAVQNPEVQNLVEDTQDRIKAIGLVHEKLYKSDNLSKVNLKDYISSLARLLIDNHSMGNKITLTYDLEEVYLLIDSVIPCGLIITELIMNSVKHAFPGDMKGNIDIKLRRRRSNQMIELIIADNGVGIKEHDENNEKLGLQLFKDIAENQLDATVSLKTDPPGVEWSIYFTDTLYEERVKS